jgi:acyl transferase domain-containing protein
VVAVPFGVELAVGAFPGQGAYYPGCLEGLEGEAALGEIDAVASRMLGRDLTGTVGGAQPPSIDTLLADAPDVLQLAIFGGSLLVHGALRARGVTFTTLVGHSLGEISALTAAGAFTVREGAEIVCHRIAALREHDTSGGGLVALGCDRERAEQMLALLPEPPARVAVDNGPHQVVVSGAAETLRRITAVAAAIGVPATPLAAAHPFHHPLLAGARDAFAERIAGYRSRGLRTPVFSPILGRFYRDSDDLAALLAAHLVTPVDFGGTVRRLHAAGARIWVEVGAGRALTNLARHAAPDLTVLAPRTPQLDTVAETAAFLTMTAGGPAPAAAVAVPQSAAATVAEVTAAPPARPSPASPPPVDPPPPAAGPTPEAAAAPGQAIDREQIADRVRGLYATALEYPPEVFEDGAELEAELGVDSVKQTELLTRVGELFQLGPRPEGLRIAELRTFGRVVDFVLEARSAAR